MTGLGELSVGSCIARLKLFAMMTKRDMFSNKGFWTIFKQMLEINLVGISLIKRAHLITILNALRMRSSGYLSW